MSKQLLIRPAKPSDTATLLALITELAIYEKAEHEVLAAEATIKSSLFTAGATAKALIAENAQGKAVGYAIYFYNYST